MYYNTRLHQRRPGEHGEHYQGCALHDLEHQRTTRSSLSPIQSNGSSRYSSLSSLYQRKSRQSTPQSRSSVEKRNSHDDNSNSSVQSKSSQHDSDDSLSRFKATVYESAGHKGSRSKSVTSLNNKRNSPQKTFGPVQIKSCDSPDHIIATLFPVTEFMTGSKGKCNNRGINIENLSATPRKDNRNLRAKSVSSDHSLSTKNRNDKPNGRLLSVERDFVNLR